MCYYYMGSVSLLYGYCVTIIWVLCLYYMGSVSNIIWVVCSWVVKYPLLARAIVIAGEPCLSGGRLATTLVATIFIIIFFFFSRFFPRFFFFSVVTFSRRRSARIKKLIQRKWLEMANNLGLDPFPDPVGHFGAPWRPFWIFEVLIEGMMESKKLFSKS